MSKNKLILLENLQQKPQLHANIINILFENKKEIYRKLSDLRNIHYVNHISINIINSLNEISIFSVTPSVEFNLIAHGLWQYDTSFYPKNHSDGDLIWWNDAYHNAHRHELKKLKESQHGFTLGFNLVRKFSDRIVVYSFATRSSVINLKKYYEDNLKDLFGMGDYGYKLIENIYEKYSAIALTSQKLTDKKNSTKLKLVVNNQFPPFYNSIL